MARTKPQPPAAPDHIAAERKKLLAQIHIARKDLALTEDSYRDVVRRITGHESATLCSPAQLRALVAEFRRFGWKGGKRPLRGVSAKPQVRMIFGVWADLGPALGNPGREGLRAFCKRQLGVDTDPNFLSPEDATRVLEGLKAWRTRLQKQAKEKA